MQPRFWHVGLTVSDLERSANVCHDVVGMAEGLRMPSANPKFAALVNLPGARLDSVFLTLDGFTLQLRQYLTQTCLTLTLCHNNIGSPHLSFFVADAAAKLQSVTAHGGVRITSATIISASNKIKSF